MSKSSRLEALSPIGVSNRLRRMLWLVVYMLFYRPTPIFAHAWRSQILRLFGAEIDKGVYPYPKVRIWAPWNLVMRKGSCLANEVDCYNVAPIVIEVGAIVSQKTYLCAASHDYNSSAFTLIGGSIVIGRNSWVAADVFIGPGISIGSKAVVLARSVVVRDVEAGTVVGGNPARVVGQRARFEKEEEKNP